MKKFKFFLIVMAFVGLLFLKTVLSGAAGGASFAVTLI